MPHLLSKLLRYAPRRSGERRRVGERYADFTHAPSGRPAAVPRTRRPGAEPPWNCVI